MTYVTSPSGLTAKFVEMIKAVARNKPLKACVSMTLGICFHFLGYECARAASITLLAAKDVGLGNEAIPLTIAIGSPLSGLVLYLYTKSIKKYGSKFTLRVSFAAVIFFMSIITFYGRALKGVPGKAAIVAFYAFREIYVSLLSSQQWAFIAGTLNKSTSSYIVVFSGVASVASVVGGCSIEQLVAVGGVQALLVTALLACIGSCLCAELAYSLSDVQPPTPTAPPSTEGTSTTTTAGTPGTATVTATGNNHKDGTLNPEAASGLRQRLHSTDDRTHHHSSHQHNSTATTHTTTTSSTAGSSTVDKDTGKDSHAVKEGNKTIPKKKGGFWSDSWNLIWKHPMLQILFVEGLLHQLCGNMLNLMFHNGLRLEIADDATRARLVGRFFATVNITSCTLQCFVLPHILSHATLPEILSKMPLIVLAGALLGVVNPGLISVMLGFGTIKVLEYSIMHSASEMIYMPMGHEVRYLGKELIRFFGHKLGKSASSLMLSALVSQMQPSLAMQSMWGAFFTICWGGAMLVLSKGVRERDHEEERELQRSAAVRAARTAEMKTRRKARSFSLDDSAIKHSSNSKATLRVPLNATTVSATHAAVIAHSGTGHSNSKAAARSLSATREAAVVGGHRSVSLDHRASPQRSHKTLQGLLQGAARQVMLEETIPEHPQMADCIPKIGADAEGERAYHLSARAVPSPVAGDGDGLDTITDVSGSPEASVPSSRSHNGSMDSIASLGQDFERGESFSEAVVGIGMSGIDEDEESAEFRRSLSSVDSMASLQSRERRVSWERDQRRRERAGSGQQQHQPVMLRVGSVSVSLNTFNERAERRRAQRDSPP